MIEVEISPTVYMMSSKSKPYTFRDRRTFIAPFQTSLLTMNNKMIRSKAFRKFDAFSNFPRFFACLLITGCKTPDFVCSQIGDEQFGVVRRSGVEVGLMRV